MKTKLQFIAAIALAASLLSACSNQKFAFRQKVKADKQEVAAVKKVKPAIRTEEISSLNESAAEIVASPAKEEAIATTEHSSANNPVIAKKAQTRSIEKLSLLKTSKNAGTTLSQKKISKKITSDTLKPHASVDSRKLIIVGLILILIGIVLSIAIGWLGGLVATVGVILALIGLIFLLIDNV